MAKKLHWTRRPENKDKVRQMVNRSVEARNKSNTPKVTGIVAEIQQLEKRARTRLEQITEEMNRLTVERGEIVTAFPGLRTWNDTMEHPDIAAGGH